MALVAPIRHVKMHLKNQNGVIEMQKISITNTVRQCHSLILQFESNEKIDNCLFIKDANEFHIIYTKLIEMLTELDQSMHEYMKLFIASSKNMSQGVLEQKITGQKDQMTYYSNIVENVKLGRNETIFNDIYSILDVSKQPVLNKQSCETKPDTSLKLDPSTSQISLSCKFCKFSTKKTKASKSKQKMAAHMNSKHPQLNPSCDLCPDLQPTDHGDVTIWHRC